MKTILLDLPTYLDYNWLMYALKDYTSPRVRVNALLRKGEIIRVKKGLYVPGAKYGRNISRGVLANLIYGPSYVSYEYALSWYGLIPERVYGIASACTKRNKEFRTHLGTFWYRKIPMAAFACGVDLAEEAGERFHIATPEKALADTVARFRELSSERELAGYLFESLRIEPDEYGKLNATQMKTIANVYGRRSVHLLADHLCGRCDYE